MGRMNLHHVELFWHVARHGGVSAAARKMPYGIQQPAISAQIIQLEDALGTTLFHRRPFQLTKAGEELHAFIEPFFAGLDDVAKRLRGGGEEMRVRLGAPEMIQREYLPTVLKGLKRRHPALNFTLTTARLDEVERLLLAQELDLGLASLDGRRPEGLKSEEFLRVPLVLLVPARSGLTTAESLWRRDRIEDPLISLPPHEPVARLFQSELARRGIEWYPQLEFASLDLVERYVAEGFGIGLSVRAPGAPLPATLRTLALEGFPELPFGAMWRGQISPAAKLLLGEMEEKAEEFRK